MTYRQYYTQNHQNDNKSSNVAAMYTYHNFIINFLNSDLTSNFQLCGDYYGQEKKKKVTNLTV